MTSIRAEIENSFRNWHALTKLIIVNLGVFLLYYIFRAIGSLITVPIHQLFEEWIALPNTLNVLVTRPWTLVTYMFFHQGFIHIFFNLLILYLAGKLFLEYLGDRRLLSFFILGGLIGGVMFVIFYNIFPAFEGVVTNNRGASAGVMAILIGIAAYVPRFPVKLFFVLKLDLWIVAALVLLMDLVAIGDQKNMGGHIAHLGGAFFGYLSVQQYKRGHDWTEGFSKFMDNLVNWFRAKPKVRKVYSKPRNDRDYKAQQVQNQQKMDEILDKISKSGYDSLSGDEKDYLFKLGQDK
ncbi:MAG: rhomboid family intramembrane serine protease [Owenweeksia sp.]|nr:rhomboid family intramembrane serine protease [Owenweeksia sp.]